LIKNGRLGSICGKSWLRDDVHCREIGFAFLGQEGSTAEGLVVGGLVAEGLVARLVAEELVEPVAWPTDFQ
jgi:hypothetical protein